MSGRQRIGLLALAVVVAVVAFVALRSGGGGSDKTSGAATVEVRNAQPVGGVQDLTWKKGQTIDLTVRSDTADEVHFHGYDKHADVAKGGSVHFRFPATIEGRFIVELESHKVTLANVEVAP